MPALTARYAIVAALASLAAVLVPGTVVARLAVVNAILIGVALVDWLLAPRGSQLRIERDLPRAVTLGASAEVVWQVHNTTGRAFRVAVADALAPSLRATDRRFSGRVPARGVLTATATLTPSRRGRFTPTDLVWRTFGPLGLWARQGRVALPATLRVYPEFRSRREAEIRIDRARILEVGLRTAKGRGSGTDFDQLRDYSVDDEFRRIDWSATARAGRPIVRTFRAEKNQNVVLLFDNGRVMAGRVDGVPRSEFAMDAALLVTTVATRLGDRCGLVAFDRDVRARVTAGHGRGQVSRVTEALYELEPVLDDSDYAGAFRDALVRFRRRSLFVLLTDLVEQSVDEALLPALPALTRSHVVLVGAIADPQVLAWATGPVDDEASAYRQAAAVRTQRARERAAQRLRAAGATVVEVAPDQIAGALGDAYLDLKATGRI